MKEFRVQSYSVQGSKSKIQNPKPETRNFETQIAAEFAESIQIKQRVLAEQLPALSRILQVLLKALGAGNKVLLFGNGGSAADAQHIAAELVSKFRRNRGALPAIALTTDTSILTSIGNDFGFEHAFARQIEALGQIGDVAIGLSTSGNSPNVLHGLHLASEMGLTAIGFTGQNGGKLKDVVDICFHAPSQSTARIQEIHITAAHALCELIEQTFAND
jgi:D-sedoheptulose 7-phosphate isomerase